MEEKRLLGHLKIGVRDDVPTDMERLLSSDLSFKLDGVEIADRLGHLKIEVKPRCVVQAEMTLFLTDVEIDAPLLEMLVRLEQRGEKPEREVGEEERQ